MGPGTRRPDRMKLTPEYLRECFAYNPDSGALVWLRRPVTHFRNAGLMKRWNTRYSGKEAGSTTPIGYRIIGINDHTYNAHRIVWMLVYGTWPAEDIDHVNRDRSDNRITNLRLASRSENNYNSGLRKNNSSGVKGVSWNNLRGMWSVNVNAKGKNVFRGLFHDKEEAIAVCRDARKKIHGQFANHG